jgi:hypothetical protein
MQAGALGCVRLTSAHLLCNHNNARGLRCASKARNSKDLNKPSEDIAGLCKSGFIQEGLLLIQKSLDVVQVSSSLKWGIP